MDLSAFSHGQVLSKIWLCEELEKYVHAYTSEANGSRWQIEARPKPRVVVLGCWYNLTAFLLFARNQWNYSKIDGIDFSTENVSMADKINDAWKIENKLDSYFADVNNTFYQNYDLVICSSVEDIQGNAWYQRIPEGHLVCLQTLNLSQTQVKKFKDWNIVNPTKTMKEFKEKYPMKQTLYEGSKKFDYGDLKYTRFMIIGIK